MMDPLRLFIGQLVVTIIVLGLTAGVSTVRLIINLYS